MPYLSTLRVVLSVLFVVVNDQLTLSASYEERERWQVFRRSEIYEIMAHFIR